MMKEGERQAAIVQFSYGFRTAVLDLIANGLCQTGGIDAKSYTLEKVLTHGRRKEH